MDRTEMLRRLSQQKAELLRGDEARVKAQHDEGKLTARERIGKLFDTGSFVTLDAFKQGGVMTGYGTVHGRAAYCFAQDITQMGGAMSQSQSEKILKALDMARLTGAPVIAYLDSAGALLSEGALALAAYAKVLGAMSRLSGVCPMICCVAGECRGVATMFTQICDITVQVEKGQIALNSLLVMQSGADKDKVAKDLFGSAVMAAQGAVALTAASEDEAAATIMALLDILPACNAEDAPLTDGDDLNRVLPIEGLDDGMSVAAQLADNGQVIELYKAHGDKAHTVLCRVGGRSCGIVALSGGRMTACDCQKIARFVRLCDCYQMPILSLIDTQGLEAPDGASQADVIKAASRMLYAYAEATAPKLAVITGSAIGAGYVAMGGKAIADVAYAWPQAVIAALPADAAVQTMYAERLNKGESREALEDEYNEKNGAVAAASLGIVDDCIDPRETRKLLIASMEFLSSKHDVNLPKKHGNLPL